MAVEAWSGVLFVTSAEVMSLLGMTSIVAKNYVGIVTLTLSLKKKLIIYKLANITACEGGLTT